MCCRVSKCCCCIDLRTGIIAIACIWLVGDAAMLAWTANVIYAINVYLQNAEFHFDDEALDPEERERRQIITVLVPQVAFWLAVMGAVLSSLAVLLDIMLLAGAINARRRLVHGWMVGYAVLYCVGLVYAALFVVSLFLSHVFLDLHGPYGVIAIAIGMLLHIALMAYFWIVVRSYYLELGQQYGDGQRCTAGKVYRTVPTGDIPTIQGTYSYGNAMVMAPTAPPQYSSHA